MAATSSTPSAVVNVCRGLDKLAGAAAVGRAAIGHCPNLVLLALFARPKVMPMENKYRVVPATRTHKRSQRKGWVVEVRSGRPVYHAVSVVFTSLAKAQKELDRLGQIKASEQIDNDGSTDSARLYLSF